MSLMTKMQADSVSLEMYRTANERIVKNINKINKRNEQAIAELFAVCLHICFALICLLFPLLSAESYA